MAENSSNETKPIKVNKWEGTALKNALDDACKKYFKDDLNYVEDYKLVDGRLSISFIAVLFSAFALLYDWLYPFPKSRSILIVCALAYFILIGILTLYMQFVECGKFFVGKLIERAGIDRASRCTLSSKLKKYDDNYQLTINYFDGLANVSHSKTLAKSVGKYFDENGVLCYDKFCTDLKKLHDDKQDTTGLQARKRQ